MAKKKAEPTPEVAAPQEPQTGEPITQPIEPSTDETTGLEVQPMPDKPAYVYGIDDQYKPHDAAPNAIVVTRKPTTQEPAADAQEQNTGTSDEPQTPVSTEQAAQVSAEPAQEQNTDSGVILTNEADHLAKQADVNFANWVGEVADHKKWKPDVDGSFEEIDIWVTKFDGGYLGGKPEDFRWLFDAGITEQIQKRDPEGNTATIGFNPAEQKWYGWSHRASFGFGVGHTVRLGDSGFVPSNKEEFRQQQERWHQEDTRVDVRTQGPQKIGDRHGVVTTWTVPGPDANGMIYQPGQQFDEYPETWGRGEWTAETLEDAKQMAKDFVESVG